MKKIQFLHVCVSLSLAISVTSFAQSDGPFTKVVNKPAVVISDASSSPVAEEDTAILQLNSNNKGFLMPRMTNTERIAIQSPANGLQVYVKDFDNGTIMFYHDNKWRALSQLSSRPDPPTEVKAFAAVQNGKAIITFKAPEEDGGSSITFYSATSISDGATNTITTVNSSGEGSIVIDLLSSGDHTFGVTATNAIGPSAMTITSSTINIVGTILVSSD